MPCTHLIYNYWHAIWGRIFVLGHCLFRELNSFPRASLSGSCSLPGTDNVQGKKYGRLFASNGGFCVKCSLVRLKYIPSSLTTAKNSVILYYISNKTLNHIGRKICQFGNITQYFCFYDCFCFVRWRMRFTHGSQNVPATC